MDNKSVGRRIKDALQLLTCRVNLVWKFRESDCLWDCVIYRETKLS